MTSDSLLSLPLACSCPGPFNGGGDALSWGCSLTAAGTALTGQGVWDPGWAGFGGRAETSPRRTAPREGISARSMTPASCKAPVSPAAAGHCHCSCSPCQPLAAPAGTNQGANLGLVCRGPLSTHLRAQSKRKRQGCSGPVLKCTQRG